MSGVWGLVPLLSSTEALCLLAMAHIDEEAPAPPEYVEVDQVAAATGLVFDPVHDLHAVRVVEDSGARLASGAARHGGGER